MLYCVVPPAGDLYKDDFSEDDNRRNQNLFEDLQQRLESEVGAAGWLAGCLDVWVGGRLMGGWSARGKGETV